MNWYSQAQALLTKKLVKPAVLALALLLIAGWAVSQRQSQTEPVATELPPVVQVTTAATYSGSNTINLIGTVRAFSEAALTSEVTGRVTSVGVGLGDTIAAGTIIATIENASEQASVLQAQGVYEAALASLEQSQFGNAQSQVGADEAATRLQAAQNNAAALTKTAYSTVEGIIFNNIDQFYGNPDSFVPGLRLDGRGMTSNLNATRVTYQTALPTWRSRSSAVSATSDLDAELRHTSSQVATAQNYVNSFISLLQQQDTNRYTEVQLNTFANTFNGLRNNLITLQSQIDTAQNNLTSAREGIARANLTVTSSNSAAADAQVKQALGSLRSAQANLAKTIIRTPISGTVNSLSIRTGDFVSSGSQVAQVANNNALEVVTFAGEKDLGVINVGDTVQLEGLYVGTVTQIAPAVNTGTGKTEIRIASETPDLQNGDSVRITKEVTQTVSTDIIIPLSAVKFALQDGTVFVIENDRLVARLVTLGTIRGGSVEILDGLSSTDEFVADARGLVEATEVEIIR